MSDPPTSANSFAPKAARYGYNEVPTQFTEDRMEQMRRQDELLKRRIRMMRAFSRVASAILAAAILGIMARTLQQYYTSRNVSIDGQTPWAKDTKLWPTLMLFIIAVVTFVLNAFILLAYCCSVAAANRTSSWATVVTILLSVGHIVVWVVVAVVYRLSREDGVTGPARDLWGWACSDAADELQEKFQDIVNFDTIFVEGYRLRTVDTERAVGIRIQAITPLSVHAYGRECSQVVAFAHEERTLGDVCLGPGGQ
ncbi:MAG: hypothetical protein M1829_002353 [Trizodia sp. TS-e1964]|nr:MAG: hypothetical protein M1829_002353 [Trizodia sp. TS-e1964]